MLLPSRRVRLVLLKMGSKTDTSWHRERRKNLWNAILACGMTVGKEGI